tara:strand:- start:1157 stop:1690 length:534 start_codon:yes stop_codon:yes gene_type:complete
MAEESENINAIKGVDRVNFIEESATILRERGYEVKTWDIGGGYPVPYTKIKECLSDELPFLYIGGMGDNEILGFWDIAFDGDNVKGLMEVTLWADLKDKSFALSSFDMPNDISFIEGPLGIIITTQPASDGREQVVSSDNTTGLIAIGENNFKMPKPINWLSNFPLSKSIRMKLKKK